MQKQHQENVKHAAKGTKQWKFSFISTYGIELCIA